MLKVKLIAWILLLVLLGFFREMIFEHLNKELEVADSSSMLNTIKWALTLLFMGLYLGLTLLISKQLFDDKIYTQVIVLIYGAFFFASFVLYAAGFLITHEIGYTMARRLMGMVQSPVLSMIILAGLYLGQKMKLKK